MFYIFFVDSWKYWKYFFSWKIGSLAKRPVFFVKYLISVNLFFAVLFVSTPESCEKEMVCFSFPNMSKILLAQQFVAGDLQAWRGSWIVGWFSWENSDKNCHLKLQ